MNIPHFKNTKYRKYKINKILKKTKKNMKHNTEITRMTTESGSDLRQFSSMYKHVVILFITLTFLGRVRQKFLS